MNEGQKVKAINIVKSILEEQEIDHITSKTLFEIIRLKVLKYELKTVHRNEFLDKFSLFLEYLSQKYPNKLNSNDYEEIIIKISR